MASQRKPPKTHVDNSVGERRLRQIYDWLDNGNNKKALQEADKALKKQSNFLCVKVLKALALLRLGKEDESLPLLEAVRQEVPTDDATLQAMTICYRELQQPNRVCEMYDAAAKKDPNNEEILSHLFMSYVRMGDYKEQQKTAMRLYRIKPKNPYYFWAVMSVVMQAYHADENIARMVTLPLAERMVQKFINEGKIEAEQEVQLYLMILEKQGKLQEALDVVEGPLGECLVSYITVPQKKASLLIQLKRWKECIVLHKQLLKENLDNWSSYADYLTSALSLYEEECDTSAAPSDDMLWTRADASPQQVGEFLHLVIREMEAQGKKLRGPLLAWLELYKRLKEKGFDAESVVGDVLDLFVKYFRLFGNRSCCASDLKQYLPLLPSDCRGELIKQVWHIVGLEDGELPDNLSRMQQHISTVLLSRFLGYHESLTATEKLQLSTCLLRYFQHGMRFNVDPLPTDFLNNDPYVTLMAHVLLDAWVDTQDSTRLLDVLLLLEHALLMSPSNFHFKLLLVKCYHLLGAGRAAHDVYQTLDVKHMQLDSLGYIHCGSIQATGQYTMATTLYDVTLRFFSVNYKDSVDYLSFTYKFGSFVKIEEFVEFRERLSNSLHYAIVTVERMLIDILHSSSHSTTSKVIGQMEILADKGKVDWKKLNDNRDAKAYVCWDPPERQVTSEVVKLATDADTGFLRLRKLLLRGVAAAMELCSSDAREPLQTQLNHINSGASDSMVNGKESTQQHPLVYLESIVEELSSTYDDVKASAPAQISSRILGAPLPSRLHGYLDTNAVPLQLLLFKLVASVAHGSRGESSAKALSEGGTQATGLIGSSIDSVVLSAVQEGSVPLASRRIVFEHIVNIVEMVCLAALACGIVRDILEPAQQNIAKKGKKKKQESVESQCPVMVEAFNKVVTELQCVVTQLDITLGVLQAQMPVKFPANPTILQPPTSNQTLQPPSTSSVGCCGVPAVGVLPSPGSDDINVLSTGMAQLVLSYENRRNAKDKGFSVNISAKLSESYDGSFQEIRSLVQQKVSYLDSVKL